MSMNIHIQATRSVIVEATGSKAIQTVHYEDEWQTPTSVSWDIYGPPERTNEERIEAYCKWAMDYPAVDPEYAEYHVEQLREWIELHRKCGFNVEVFVW